MRNSLQKHGLAETHKQISTRVKRDGLDTVAVQVTRKSGKLLFNFTGSTEQVAKAHKIIADWN
jgi:N-methylhydantoinase B/oxoprolinase/acetone carboxylase alpha subunit